MKNKSYLTAPDIAVGFAELEPHAQSQLDKSHCHERYEILYIIDGEGKYTVEGAEYKIVPRTLMFIRPYEYHHLSLNKNAEYRRYCIHFTQSSFGPEVARLLESMVSTDDSRGNHYSAAHLPGEIDTVFDRLDMAESLSEELRRVYVRALITELIIMLSAYSAEKRPSEEGELGERVIRYLNNNIEKDLSLDKLARRFFVSKYYLCRAFKKHNGISVHGYVNHKRVLYAKQLIEAGETASGAAYKVGFGDYSAFYRAYVRIIGKAPTDGNTEEGSIGNE